MNIQDLVLTRTEDLLSIAQFRLKDANYNLNNRDPQVMVMHTVNGLLIEEALISLGAIPGDGIAWDLMLPNDNLKYDVKFAAEGLKSAIGFVKYYSKKLFTSTYSEANGLIAGMPLSFSRNKVKSYYGEFEVDIWTTAKIFYAGKLVI